MKRLLIIFFSLGLALGASAQKIGHVRGFAYSRPRVVVGLGAFAPLYPYYGLGYSPYSPYGSYGPRYGYGRRPSRLDLKIEDIKNDYQDKIWAARHDKTLPRSERRKLVHQLKHERDQAITDTKRNYYKL